MDLPVSHLALLGLDPEQLEELWRKDQLHGLRRVHQRPWTWDTPSGWMFSDPVCPSGL